MTADAAEVGESLRLTIIGLDKCFRGEGCEMVRSIGKIDTLLRVGRKVALPPVRPSGLGVPCPLPPRSGLNFSRNQSPCR